MVAIACVFRMQLWGFGVTQAYLQSDTKLARDIYIEAPMELQLEEGKLLRLVKGLYGLTDSGDSWNRTLRHVLLQKLHMIPSPNDLALYWKITDGSLDGLAATQVDGILAAGTACSNETSLVLGETFD